MNGRRDRLPAPRDRISSARRRLLSYFTVRGGEGGRVVGYYLALYTHDNNISTPPELPGRVSKSAPVRRAKRFFFSILFPTKKHNDFITRRSRCHALGQPPTRRVFNFIHYYYYYYYFLFRPLTRYYYD